MLEFKSENQNLQHRLEVSTESTDTIYTSPILKVGDVCRVVFSKVGEYSVVDPVYSFVERGIVKVVEGGESDSFADSDSFASDSGESLTTPNSLVSFKSAASSSSKPLAPLMGSFPLQKQIVKDTTPNNLARQTGDFSDVVLDCELDTAVMGPGFGPGGRSVRGLAKRGMLYDSCCS